MTEFTSLTLEALLKSLGTAFANLNREAEAEDKMALI